MSRPTDCPYQITWITDRLAVGGAPMSFDQLDYLKAQGIVGILNLCAEFCDLRDIESASGFEVFYLPIRDDDTPDTEDLERALEWLDESLYLGKRVLIHCRLGMGRTGTVLSAYLLRRGLGQDQLEAKLKGLRSRPTNYCQWQLVRDYGRKAGRLAIREPSLEFGHELDLSGYFQVYEEIRQTTVAAVDDRYSALGHCGKNHSICCRMLVDVPFIEAAWLNTWINTNLTAQVRLEVISRARDNLSALRGESAQLRREGFVPDSPDFRDELRVRYARLGRLCALNEHSRCRLYDYRPIACLLFDADPDIRFPIQSDLLEPNLSRLSGELFLAFTSTLPRTLPVFTLPEVLSGAYVQSFFNLLKGREG